MKELPVYMALFEKKILYVDIIFNIALDIFYISRHCLKYECIGKITLKKNFYESDYFRSVFKLIFVGQYSSLWIFHHKNILLSCYFT